MVSGKMVFNVGLLMFASLVTAVRKTPTSIFLPMDFAADLSKFESCNVSWNQIEVSGFRAHLGRHLRTYDADLRFKSGVLGLNKITFHIRRCRDAVSYNTCEHFAVWSYDKPCGIITSEGAFWKNMVRSSTPQFQCPIKKTTYEFRNFSVDLDRLNAMRVVLTGFVWNFLIHAFDPDNRHYACLDVQGEVVHF